MKTAQQSLSASKGFLLDQLFYYPMIYLLDPYKLHWGDYDELRGRRPFPVTDTQNPVIMTVELNELSD